MCYLPSSLIHVDGPLLESQSQSKEGASPSGELSKHFPCCTHH